MLFKSTRHRGLVAPTLLGLIAAPLAVLVTSAPAQAAGPGLVINEVYGGGGNTIATFENDFVELRNTSTEPISLTGKSLQYRGPNSVVLPLAENVLVLPDVAVPAGETFLVKGATASGEPNPPGAPLPEPDMTSTLNMGGTDGQIYLVDTASPTNPNLVNNTSGNQFDPNVLDFVGYGAATSFEGAGPTPAPTAAVSVSRDAGGADTDSNGTDFTVSAPPSPLATREVSDVVAAPEPVTYGQDWTAAVSVAPAAATGSVEILDGATPVGTATLTDGSAEVPISGTALAGGSHTLKVRYLGDATYAPSEGSVDLEVAKAVSSTQLTLAPAVVVGQGRTTMSATVEGVGSTPTGDVEFKVNGVSVGTSTLEEGEATFSGGPFNAVGTFDVTASYLGDTNTEASESDAAELQVVKAAAALSVTTTPGKVVVDRTRVKVTTAVRAGGQAATGRIQVKVGNKTYKATLANGRVTVALKPFPTTGKKQVKITYLGNATTKPAVKTLTIKVVRKK